MLKKQGIDSDLIDLESMVDSSLSLSENARIISEDVKLMQQTGQINLGTKSPYKVERFLKAVQIYEKRSNRKQRMDSSKQAKKTFEKSQLTEKNYNKWKKNPNRYDIQGVDTKYN